MSTKIHINSCQQYMENVPYLIIYTSKPYNEYHTQFYGKMRLIMLNDHLQLSLDDQVLQ